MRNKKRMSLLLAIAAVLILAMPVMASAANTTTATITFTDGGLTWGDLDGGLNGMNMTFGSHTLPTGAITYDSTSSPHSITISDARATTTGWNVKVSMTAFTATGITPFNGTVTLSNGACADANVTVQSSIGIVSGAGSVPVASAAVAAGRGAFEVKWNNADQATLTLSGTEALNVDVGTYQATLTWVLGTAP